MTTQNLIAFVCGPKGSGKTIKLHTHFVPKFPRVISLDITGEMARDHGYIETVGVRETLELVKRAASRGVHEWRIAAIVPQDDVGDLLVALAPEYEPGKVSVAQSLGGLAIECSEAYHLLPATGGDERVKDVIFRARHHRLSFLLAAQRPHTVGRAITSQADVIASFRQIEPRDKKWLADAISSPVAAEVERLDKYWCMYYVKDTATAYILDPRGRVRRTLDLYGKANVARSRE